MQRTYFLWLMLSLAVAGLYAQGPPVFSDTPIMLGLEGRGLRTFGKYTTADHARSYLHILAIPVNLTSRLQVGAVIPFNYRSLQGDVRGAGPGDVAVFAKYLLFQRDQQRKTFRVAAKMRQGFPTGNTREAPPLGSGAYQSLFSLVSGYVTTSFGLYAELGYLLINRQRTDQLMYNLAFVLPLLPQQYPPKQLNISLELNGNKPLDQNRNQLLAGTGIQWITGRKLLLEGGVQLPLFSPTTSRQFIVLLGGRILIF